MNANALLRTVTTKRTFFPELLAGRGGEVPDNVLLTGCMKAIEETGIPGLVVMPGGGIREIREAKVTIKPACAE